MKNIVVTGASGVLGGAVIEALDVNNNNVFGLDAAVRQPIVLAREGCFLGGCDLTDPDATRRALASVWDAMRGIDILVHTAGTFAWEEIESGSPKTWQKMFDVNVMTSLNITQALLPHFNRNGAIVFVGAEAALAPEKGMGAYTASKSAVHCLGQSLADELVDRNIRVNTVLPRIIDTPKNRKDMPHADFSTWTAPDAIADVIGFLVSDQARGISGASIPVTASV